MDTAHMTATDIVLIITALTTGIVAIIGAVKASAAATDAKQANVNTAATHSAVNGRLGELVAAAKSDAYREGHAAGFAEALPLQVTPPATDSTG